MTTERFSQHVKHRAKCALQILHGTIVLLSLTGCLGGEVLVQPTNISYSDGSCNVQFEAKNESEYRIESLYVAFVWPKEVYGVTFVTNVGDIGANGVRPFASFFTAQNCDEVKKAKPEIRVATCKAEQITEGKCKDMVQVKW